MSGGLAIDDAAWAGAWRPRAVADKALLGLGLMAVALVLPPWPGSVLVAVASLVVLLLGARVPAGLVARAMRAPLAFIVLSGLSVAVSLGAPQADPAYLRLGWLAVTHRGVAEAAGLTAHAVAGTLAVLVLAATTPVVDLLTALRRLRMPDACVEVASLTYRILFVLLEAQGQIREAQAGRLGYQGWRTSLRSAGMLTAAVLTRSWDRARRLEEGLAGRGYETALLTLPRTERHSPAFVAGTLLLLATVSASSWALGAR
ncbi:cobalt ECF transporter T component CbiQ [Arsenicicoccus dermatophilus]|uniref:cobalt ECF transporter T component CbiQ n=1 Tax=Arsenicicoccus dermatophilus TaxID=1076331 RepID=UPI001F4D0431|nr:cobalt ECF transporter T component CbiQ [Arsenicicoccus dermatophilus]